MDRYPDFEGYKQAKYNIFQNQGSEQYSLVNSDEKHCEEIAAFTKGSKAYFGSAFGNERGVYLSGDILVWNSTSMKKELVGRDELSLPGPHNLSNSMAAAAMALLAGADPEGIRAGLKNFVPLEHRLEPVAEKGGVRFVNDSKATNIDSALVALKSYDSPVIPILGGRDKAGDFTVLNPVLKERSRCVILLGEASEKIDRALDPAIRRLQSKDLPHAVKLAYKNAKNGDVVLLAPGCASFDMFDNFEQRGRRFKEIVRSLDK
jgi:UDP-N-acetylmuramoylalanine--D-glutamate ligase